MLELILRLHKGREDTCRVGIVLENHDNVETWRFTLFHKVLLGVV